MFVILIRFLYLPQINTLNDLGKNCFKNLKFLLKEFQFVMSLKI